MDVSVRTRAISLWSLGYTIKIIQERFAEEEITVSKKSLHFLIKKFKHTGSVTNKCPSPLSVLRKLEEHHLVFINKLIAYNFLFLKEFPETPVSISTVKRVRQERPWMGM